MSKLTKIGIVGAGNMGCGIAQKIAQENCGVVLVDVNDEILAGSLANIRRTLQQGVKRKILTEEGVEEIIGRVKPTADLNELADCQLIIEAIIEDMDVKKNLFRELDGICRPDTVFATNTSTLSVSEMAQASGRADRFVGLHFFYHPAMNRLLEVVFPEGVTPEARSMAVSAGNLMRKTTLFVADAPGFAVNRFFIPWSLSGLQLYDEGLGDIASIDEATKKTFGVGMGPFEFMNFTGGFNLAHMTSSTLARRLNSFYGPPAALERKREAGGIWDLSGEPDPETFPKLRDRMLGVVFYVASELVNEGVATMVETDIGAKVGLRWRYGPFELMNQVGIEESYRLARFVVDSHPELTMPANLEAQKNKNLPWDIRLVDLSKRGETAFVTLKRPEAMNALNETVFRQLEEALDEIDNDPSIKTVVLGTLGKDFIAGADLGFFLDHMKTRKFDELDTYGAMAHRIARRIENSDKLTIARVQGMALGGGLEIALACDVIAASDKASFGFPETGIGICPGLGGMPRSMNKIGKPLAKYMVLTGQMVDAGTALSVGLIDHVAPITELDDMIGRLCAGEKELDGESAGECKPSVDVTRIENLFTEENVQRLISGNGLEGDSLAEKLHRQISHKAPMAVEMANTIMDAVEGLPFEKAFELELERVGSLFRSEDALEGISSVGQRRPVFQGR